MDRRHFLTTFGAMCLVGVTGCLGGDNAPPPRKSNVITTISPSTESLRVEFPADPWVISRYTTDNDVGPVGVAAAKGGGGAGGRGFTGRTGGSHSNAPKTTHGRIWFFGGGYTDDWYDDHDDETTKYPVEIRTVGVRYYGDDDQFEDISPGPGSVTWDETKSKSGSSVAYGLPLPGWYRIGTHIYGARSGHDFGWECVDCKLKESNGGLTVDEEWKVSPRI